MNDHEKTPPVDGPDGAKSKVLATDDLTYSSTPRTSVEHQLAQAYVEAGWSIVPLRLDGSKRPSLPSWEPMQSRLPTADELTDWFVDRRNGIALVMGAVSGGCDELGAETLDFDADADRVFPEWFDSLPPLLAAKLMIVETPGYGIHIIYRCSVITGNKVIAAPVEGKRMIESRGEGGYLCAAGNSSALHSSGRFYMQVAGPPLPDVPVLTVDERKTLWVAAAKFDKRPGVLDDLVRKRRNQLMPPIISVGDTPWDRFDREASWLDILQPAAWTTLDGVVWTRPGKSFGTSAKVVISNKTGCEVLTVFSCNAGPLAADNGPRTFGKFDAFCRLYHEGDRRAATRAILREAA